MAISRIHICRKVHQLTGKSVSRFICEERLGRAIEMLKNDVATVSGIAYKVGFGSPSYFNNCFHKFYGYPPGEVLIRQNEEGKRYPDLTTTDEETRINKKFPPHQWEKTFNHTIFLYILTGISTVAIIYILIWFFPIMKNVKRYLNINLN